MLIDARNDPYVMVTLREIVSPQLVLFHLNSIGFELTHLDIYKPADDFLVQKWCPKWVPKLTPKLRRTRAEPESVPGRLGDPPGAHFGSILSDFQGEGVRLASYVLIDKNAIYVFFFVSYCLIFFVWQY